MIFLFDLFLIKESEVKVMKNYINITIYKNYYYINFLEIFF